LEGTDGHLTGTYVYLVLSGSVENPIVSNGSNMTGTLGAGFMGTYTYIPSGTFYNRIYVRGEWGANRTYKLAGDVNCSLLSVWEESNTGFTTTLDTNGYNLTDTGGASLGANGAPNRKGKLINSSAATDSTITIATDLNNYSGNTIDASGTKTINISIAGNWINAGTFTPGNSTVTFTSTTTAKTVTTASQAFNNLVFNGTGGAWTLQDNLTAATITVSAGNLIDNAKIVTVNGNIDIANDWVATSSGTWIQGANGNIANPTATFKYLQISAGVVSTRTSNVKTRNLTLGAGANLTGSGGLTFQGCSTNDFFIQGAGATITTGKYIFIPL
jgi:hypothetical protein